MPADPQASSPPPACHPVLSPTGAGAYEARLFGADREAEWAAMQRAGEALARAVAADFGEAGNWPAKPRLLVLSGPGHNGGDALLAARSLLEQFPATHITVLEVIPARSAESLCAQAGAALQTAARDRVRWLAWGGATATSLSHESFDVLLDGLFGYRFRPPLAGAAAEAVRWVNAHPAIRFRASVDLPSGLTDNPSGDSAVRADITYATGIFKTPLTRTNGLPWIGRPRYLDLGFFDRPELWPAHETRQWVLTTRILDPLRRLRPAASDKRSYGHLFLLGGSRSMSGAIAMSARAALRSGVGLATVWVPFPLALRLGTVLPEAMWMALPLLAEGSPSQDGISLLRHNLPRASALLMGPGLDPDKNTRLFLTRVAREMAIPQVLDAGALQPEVLQAAGERPVLSEPVILTPHLGEYARLLRVEEADDDSGALLDFCRRQKVIVILKGPLTRISQGLDVVYSPFGGPVLARGGSGDILAGMVGSLLAQWPRDAWSAALTGTAWQGMAGDALARERGSVGVMTTELLPHLANVLRPAL